MAESFLKRIQRIMGENAPKELTGGTWCGIAYPHIYLDKKYNFIDREYPIHCDIKGNLFEGREIRYHKGAAHLNSSQVVCISFFKKFFEKEEWESVLIKALKNIGVPLSSDDIKCAVFEYEPDKNEGTNFDFYMALEDGSKVFMEIKYTESGFGGISPDKNDPDKYSRKWTGIYCEMVDKSPFLNCSKEEFYRNYQVNRNISFANKDDVVLFLTPRANDAKKLNVGRAYIDSYTASYPKIRNIYWEDLVAELMKLVSVDELRDYYTKFQEKYIDIL